MKTEIEIKKQVIDYLTKTSKHLFIKPNAKFVWGSGDKPGYYEYDYDNFTYLKVLSVNDKEFTYMKNNKIYKSDIDYYLKIYGLNTKCVIKNILFQNEKVKSVKSRINIDDLVNSFDNK